MTTFPALRPSSRPVIPGSWASVDHVAMDGGTTTVLTEAVERGRTVPMVFENITKEQWQDIVDHYRDHGLYQGFYFDPVTLDTSKTASGWWWRHAQAPSCNEKYTNIRTVSCLFEMVPIVTGAVFGGGAVTISVQVQATQQPLPSPPPASTAFGGGSIAITVDVSTRGGGVALEGAVVHIPSIAPGEVVTGAFDLPRRSILRIITTDRAGWLRLYASDAALAADAARPRETIYALASGVIADPVFVGAEEMRLMPELNAISADGSRRFPYRFTCDAGSGSATIIIYCEPY